MRIERLSPLVVYTPPYLLGQYSFSPDSSNLVVALLSLCIVVLVYIAGGRTVAMIAFLVGAFSIDYQRPHSEAPSLEGVATTRRVVAAIKYPIRRRRTGEVELRLRVQGDERGRALSGEIYCIGKDLPWKNEGIAQVGDVRAFYLKWRGSSERTCEIIAASEKIAESVGFLQSIRGVFKDSLRGLLGTNETSGILRAILLAERDVISTRTSESFKRLGMSHLLVVSGYHLSLFYASSYIVLYPLAAMLLSVGYVFSAHRLAALCALSVTGLYALLCHPQPSLVRAFVSLSLFFILSQLGRGKGGASPILFALLVVVAIWPLSFLSPGVQLTFSALTAISIANAIFAKDQYSLLMRYIAMNALISLFTGACSFIWFGELSFIGVIMNIILVPLLALICCKLGMLGLLLYIVGIDSEGYLLQTVWHVTNFTLEYVYTLAELRYVAYPFL